MFSFQAKLGTKLAIYVNIVEYRRISSNPFFKEWRVQFHTTVSKPSIWIRTRKIFFFYLKSIEFCSFPPLFVKPKCASYCKEETLMGSNQNSSLIMLEGYRCESNTINIIWGLIIIPSAVSSVVQTSSCF